MRLVLAFDCAVTGLSVAAVGDGCALAVCREAARDQTTLLPPLIAAALHAAGAERRDVGLIAVTVGPGSFTGVRAGLATARGLALGLGVPLAGIATTTVLLRQRPAADRTVVAAIDSRLGDWFCGLSPDEAPFVAGAEDLARRVAGRRCLVIGSGTAALRDRLAALQLDVTAEEALPDPVALARLAEVDGAAGWRDRNRRAGLPRPLYLRGASITLPDGGRRTVE